MMNSRYITYMPPRGIRRLAAGGRADRDQQGYSGGRSSSDNPGGGAGSSGGTRGASTSSFTGPGAGPMSGSGNATVADRGIIDKYKASPQEGIKTDRDFWSAVGNLGQRSNDYMDRGNSTLDNLGNALAGLFSVGEMDPTKQNLNASINNPNASWGVDPLGLGASLVGAAAGLPLGALYSGIKKVTGYPGPQIAFDGNQYGDYGFNSSPIDQGMGVVSADDFQGALNSYNNGTIGQAGSSPAHLGPGSGQGTNLGTAIAAPTLGPSDTVTDPTSGQSQQPTTTPATGNAVSTYSPYNDDYLTYGARPEHQFFTYNMKQGGRVPGPGGAAAHDMHEAHDPLMEFTWEDQDGNHYAGAERRSRMQQMLAEQQTNPHQTYRDFGATDQEPQYKSFGGFLKKLAKTVGPAVIGLGTSALTGSDIAGGLAGGVSSKLFGNDWLTAGLTGLGTGAASALTGASAWGDSAAQAAGNAASSAASGSGDSGFFGSALDFAKNNPAAIGAGALALASAFSSKKNAPSGANSSPPNSANDPAYAQQIRDGGWQWNRKPTDTSAVNWYQYGSLPEWDFFTGDNDFSPAAVKEAKGGSIPGNSGALNALHDAGGMADGPGGGQDDKIPVYLSAKEYVVPADVVSDLGDGNPDHGAKKLDVMRDKVRKQKGRRGFPPKAKPTASAYL